MNRLNISPYLIHEAIEDDKWIEYYKEQEKLKNQGEEAEKINKLFPIYLSDFNPNDIRYSKYLNNDFAQQSYSDFINSIIEHNSKEIIK